MLFWCLMLITWNLEFGPHQDSERRNQLRACLDKIYSFQYFELPLFEAYAPDITRQLEAAGLCSFPRAKDVAAECWDWMREQNRTAGIGRRIAFNRFGGAQHGAIKHKPFWAKRLFERTVLAIESDWMAGKAVSKTVIKPGAAEGFSDGGTTNPRVLQVADKAMLSGFKNCVVTSAKSLEMRQHIRVCDIVIELQKPLDEHHTWQNRELRNVTNTRKYIKYMVSGGAVSHVESFMQLLDNQDSLVSAGFLLPGVNCATEVEKLPEPADFLMLIEDEHADIYGQGCLSMSKQRGQRLAFWDSWP